MANVLITGAAGLLGTHLSRYLLDAGHSVTGIDDLSGGYRENLDPRMNFVEGDLVFQKMLDDTFRRSRPDYVYHFAAYAAVGLSPFIRKHNYCNNVVASANVVNACVNHGVKKIVFSSSMDVYGGENEPPYTEDMTPCPEDPYGIAKYAVEMDLKQAHRFFGLNYTIVRPHNVFGVYQNIWDKYRNVLGIWIRQTLSGQPITVYGEGSQVRSFSDIKYYMEPFEKLMSQGDCETYNIGADSHMSILEAATRFATVARKRGYNVEVKHLEKRDEVVYAYCDHTKAKRDLSFQDNTDFEVLIDQMFAWAEVQPSRPVKLMQYEIEKNMYDFWKK